MKKLVFLLLATTTLSSCLLAQNEAKKIDSLVLKYTNDAEFTGTVLISKGGNLLLKKGYGYSNTEKKIANDASTIYNIASLTKTFTAALILKLQEEGKLSIEDRLSKYYPAFPNADKITIHHLLTHTSGLFNYTDDKNFWAMDQTKEVKLEEMIVLFTDKPLQFQPGTNFRYSNSGYTMLGYIIEKVTGMSYASALDRFIFQPLGMQLTKENLQLEFNFLRSQVNPHFLFNTLNNVYGLILNDHKEKSAGVLARLSQFLRYSLYESNGDTVPVEKERQLLKDYIDLESIRLNQTKVDFTYETDNSITSMPPMLLIPVVENAFKYCSDNSDSYINMSLQIRNNIISFHSKNSVDTDRQSAAVGGIGLSNLDKRLQLYYPGKNQCQISSSGKEYSISINIDCHE